MNWSFEAQTEATMFAEPSFILYGVTIGVDFHWERKVTQKFAALSSSSWTGQGHGREYCWS